MAPSGWSSSGRSGRRQSARPAVPWPAAPWRSPAPPARTAGRVGAPGRQCLRRRQTKWSECRFGGAKPQRRSGSSGGIRGLTYRARGQPWDMRRRRRGSGESPAPRTPPAPWPTPASAVFGRQPLLATSEQPRGGHASVSPRRRRTWARARPRQGRSARAACHRALAHEDWRHRDGGHPVRKCQAEQRDFVGRKLGCRERQYRPRGAIVYQPRRALNEVGWRRSEHNATRNGRPEQVARLRRCPKKHESLLIVLPEQREPRLAQ